MIKTEIITDCDMTAVTEALNKIYNEHKVIDVKFSTDTSEFNMYYTVLIIYEVNDSQQQENH